MPTGYTADIYDGKDVSLSDYAAGCARAFGCFVHMRDDGRSATLRLPSYDTSYYTENAVRASDELTMWKAKSEEDKYAEWSDYYNESVTDFYTSQSRASALRARYLDMLAQVVAVEVDSKLENFKNFMMEQLSVCIESESKVYSNIEDSRYKPEDYASWCESHEKRLKSNDAYYTDCLGEYIERYESQVEFIELMANTFGFEVSHVDEA